MPKKSSKKPSQSEEKSTVGQAKPVPKTGNKLGKEIDEIFGGKKRKKPELDEGKKKTDRGTKESTTEENRMKKTKKKRREGENLGGFGDRPARTRKRTEDGLAIYTEDELSFNKANAGGTPLCPFDCDCCF